MQDWETIYKEKGSIQNEIMPIIDKAEIIFKEKNASKILDLGCGTGRHLLYLSKKDFFVCGIDISKTGLEIIESKIPSRNRKKIQLINADMKEIPFKRDEFDAVICTRTIYHGTIEDIRKTINEIKRVLKQNGIFVFTVLTTSHPDFGKGMEVEKNTFIDLPKIDSDMLHYFFTKKEIFAELDGFKKLKVEPIFYENYPKGHPQEYWCIFEKE